MAYSKEDYIKYKDFEGALYRYDNTTKNWKAHWWDCLEQIYKEVKSLHKKYILDPVNKIVKRIKEISNTIISLVSNGEEKGRKVYLIKFYNTVGDFLFSKIGTTIRAVSDRLKEEIRYYRKNFDIGYAVIESVYDCGNIPEEGVESFCRAYFIKKHPENYMKNDRFLNINIPIEEFNLTVESYLT